MQFRVRPVLEHHAPHFAEKRAGRTSDFKVEVVTCDLQEVAGQKETIPRCYNCIGTYMRTKIASSLCTQRRLLIYPSISSFGCAPEDVIDPLKDGGINYA